MFRRTRGYIPWIVMPARGRRDSLRGGITVWEFRAANRRYPRRRETRLLRRSTSSTDRPANPHRARFSYYTLSVAPGPSVAQLFHRGKRSG